MDAHLSALIGAAEARGIEVSVLPPGVLPPGVLPPGVLPAGGEGPLPADGSHEGAPGARGVVGDDDPVAVWARFARGERAVWVRDGTRFPDLGPEADRICSDKERGKRFLEGLGIAVPGGVVIPATAWDAGSVMGLLDRVGTIVAKPVDGTDGVGVRLGLKSIEDVTEYMAGTAEPSVLLEEQVEGEDLRIQAVGGRLACACVRRPATVVGDGSATIRELIACRNAELARQNPANRIDADEELLGLLRLQGTEMDGVPAADAEVRLKRVANVSQGGRAIDVTDQIHPTYADWVVLIAEGLGASVFALDVITPDPARDPAPAARAIEINSRPSWLHHTFSEGRTHDVPGYLLDALFP